MNGGMSFRRNLKLFNLLADRHSSSYADHTKRAIVKKVHLFDFGPKRVYIS